MSGQGMQGVGEMLVAGKQTPEGKGRILRAKRSFQQGDLIFEVRCGRLWVGAAEMLQPGFSTSWQLHAVCVSPLSRAGVALAHCGG